MRWINPPSLTRYIFILTNGILHKLYRISVTGRCLNWKNILLVTASKKSADMLIDLIHSSGWHPDRILAAASCNEARRRLIENNVDLIIINAPLTDEFGHEFASYACQNTLSGVLMLVKADLANSVSERVEQDGVVVVTKPISRAVFYQSLHLVNSVRQRIYALQRKTASCANDWRICALSAGQNVCSLQKNI